MIDLLLFSIDNPISDSTSSPVSTIFHRSLETGTLRVLLLVLAYPAEHPLFCLSERIDDLLYLKPVLEF